MKWHDMTITQTPNIGSTNRIHKTNVNIYQNTNSPKFPRRILLFVDIGSWWGIKCRISDNQLHLNLANFVNKSQAGFENELRVCSGGSNAKVSQYNRKCFKPGQKICSSQSTRNAIANMYEPKLHLTSYRFLLSCKNTQKQPNNITLSLFLLSKFNSQCPRALFPFLTTSYFLNPPE